jgi:hypothetical protein
MVDEQLWSLQNILQCFGSTVPKTVLHGVKELSPAAKDSLRYTHLRNLIQYLCIEIFLKF